MSSLIESLSTIVVLWEFWVLTIGVFGVGVVSGFTAGRRLKIARSYWLHRLLELAGLVSQKLLGSRSRKNLYHGLIELSFRSEHNAIVANNILTSRRFLDNFFRDIPDELVSGDGEVWLFQTDLGAFRDEQAFERLYSEGVLVRRHVKSVKLVLPPHLRATSESITASSQLCAAWNATLRHLYSVSHLEKPMLAKWMDQISPTPSKAFLNFVSDENWIFYVFYQKGSAYPKVCIHRRAWSVFEDAPGMGLPSDERITCTASFPEEGADFFDESDPVVKFNRQKHLREFERIFRNQNTWRPLQEIAEEQIAACSQAVDQPITAYGPLPGKTKELSK